MNQTCKTCRFWLPDTGGDAEAERWGECRRHAPRPPLTRSEAVADYYPHWPLTEESDWCGEWAPGAVSQAPPAGAGPPAGEDIVSEEVEG